MHEISKAIEGDKSLFDYGRMWLTVVAFWALLVMVISGVMSFGSHEPLTYTVGVVSLVPPSILALIQSVRLMKLTFAISQVVVGQFTPESSFACWLYGPIAGYVVGLSPVGIAVIIAMTV
ncbi:hypothetical protein [Mesorhizobium sp. M0323]|uniref:hypothetical protein n=1 Tax=Mesorhizobium sp. M0323 TaxID=2956938 RepID=UPI00333CCD50